MSTLRRPLPSGNGSVVMIARAAAAPLIGAERRERRRRCRARTLSIGSVDADDAGRRDQHLLDRAADERARSRPPSSRASRMPVVAGAGVGAAAVDDDRARHAAGARRDARCETSTGAACAWLVVKTAAAVRRRVGRRAARDRGSPFALMPALTPAARKPRGVVDAARRSVSTLRAEHHAACAAATRRGRP